MDLVRKDIQTDVLIVGGGLAGCMAAIRAAERADRDRARHTDGPIRQTGGLAGALGRDSVFTKANEQI